ncbi:MAG: hypothetical protein SVM79_06860 [Chloroflexota bacterium]|nr:hypothetical protein [Chloroflexota bacterium]
MARQFLPLNFPEGIDRETPVHFEYGRTPAVLLMTMVLKPEPENAPAEGKKTKKEGDRNE